MKNRFICKYERFYGEVEDIFVHDIYANDTKEALLIMIAMLGDFRAETQEEAVVKAEQFLNNTIEEDWTVDDFFNYDILIETCDIACRLYCLYENENINILE